MKAVSVSIRPFLNNYGFYKYFAITYKRKFNIYNSSFSSFVEFSLFSILFVDFFSYCNITE